jgi:hypothetical protein
VRLTVFAALALSAAGCNRDPNVEIVGSYFPGWMVALVFGVGLTFAVHALLRRYGLSYVIGHPAIIYPSLVTFFTCLIWLCVFA